MSQEKTEEPTPRRLRKARDEGDSATSGALVQAAAFLVAVALLPAAATATTAEVVRLIRQSTGGEIQPEPALLVETVAQTLWLVVPLLLAASLAAAAAGLVQTGAAMAPAKLAPDLQRINPVEGAKRLFDLQRVFQVARAMLAVVIVGYFCVKLVTAHVADLARSAGNASAALGLGALLSHKLLWLAVGITLALGALDWLIVRRAWLRRHRMSREEVMREHKESEGDPQIKQQRRRAHQELLTSSTLGAVKNANVVIVNPTHFATALRYLEEEDAAPRVLAQGQDLLARQMIDAARAYGIPVVRDVPVAQALKDLEPGDQIPEVLYEAVAEILRQVWNQAQQDKNDT